MESPHDELIAQVSHELRAPLHAMLGWAQMLLTYEPAASDDQIARGLQIIVRNAKLQARLIDELLDASSLLRGSLRLQLAPVAADAAVRAACDGLASAALAKDVELAIAIEDAGQYVIADGERLQQVLGHVLGNALKFSPHGGVVEVRVRRDGEQVCFEVEDDGPGIEAALVPVVFERFRRGPADKAGTGGLGLGLAIARGLVELHHGAIDVTRGGRGARVRVWLPAVPVGACGAGDSQPPPAPLGPELDGLLAGARLAIVADERDALELLRLALERAGAHVAVYASSALLLEALPAFDALIADIRIDGGRGVELPSVLEARGLRPPAIALIGQAAPRDRLRALQAGFQMHVSKPVDGHELLVTVASVLGRLHTRAR